MDPTACLRRIIEASRGNDRAEYVAACEDLAGWLRRGGFKPEIPATMSYIPGTGTPWRVLSPAPDEHTVWTLIRYGTRGECLEAYPLE